MKYSALLPDLAELFSAAAACQASDIHLEPHPRGVQVWLRVDGHLQSSRHLDTAQSAPLIAQLKILAGLNVAEHRRPQDGALQCVVAGRVVNARLSVLPTGHGESAALRLLSNALQADDLAALGLRLPHLQRLRACSTQRGLIVLSGATGSGKTTTLYTLLREPATVARKIVTIEDPVEATLSGVVQMQVNPAIDLTFATCLRAALRHDPDLLLIGEIRDSETAAIATQAALTGHTVLTTVHAHNAAAVVLRLLSLGVDPVILAGGLTLLWHQRLVMQGGKRIPSVQSLLVDDVFRDAVVRRSGLLALQQAASAGLINDEDESTMRVLRA